MTGLPDLTERDIRQWVGDASFHRGQGYYQGGSILNPRCQGETLTAQCIGSRPQPYRVEVTLGAQGILIGSCSCPVGGGGHCKHAAALLLTWLYHPNDFTEMAKLEASLKDRSQAELITLIRKMIDRYPDLEILLELPVPGKESVDEAGIRRQVDHAFQSAGNEWGAVSGMAHDLLGLVDIGDEYAEQSAWRDAVIVYRVIIERVLEQYHQIHDEEGHLHEVVNRCVEGLGQCLDATDDGVQREVILRALFETYRWDVDFGGIDMGYEASGIILEQSVLEERQLVAQWVRDAIPTGSTWSDDYHRQRYGGFLLDLEQNVLDDEAFLRICRETGRLADLVKRLLELDRVDEAENNVRRAGDYEMLQLADIFVAQGHTDQATRLVKKRAQTSQDTRLLEWLKKRAVERGDVAEALALAEKLFWQRPDLKGYDDVQVQARAVGRWEHLREEMVDRLAQDGRYTLLTEIHLKEGKVNRALETVERVSGRMYGGFTWQTPLSIRVAQAAEENHPQQAISIYTTAVRRLIDIRGRDNYATAAAYLVRVRDLYQRLGGEDIWQALITEIREQNRRLRALKEELTKVGL